MGIVLHSLQLVYLQNALEIGSQSWHIALWNAMSEMFWRSVVPGIIRNLFMERVSISCWVDVVHYSFLAARREAIEKIVVVAQCTQAPTISAQEQGGKRVQLQLWRWGEM